MPGRQFTEPTSIGRPWLAICGALAAVASLAACEDTQTLEARQGQLARDTGTETSATDGAGSAGDAAHQPASPAEPAVLAISADTKVFGADITITWDSDGSFVSFEVGLAAAPDCETLLASRASIPGESIAFPELSDGTYYLCLIGQRADG